MNIETWITSLPGAPSITAVASEAGIQKTTLFRQIERGAISAENVILICQAYDIDVAAALIAHGYCTEDNFKVEALAVREALERADWSEIFDEITKRVNASPMFEGDFELSVDSPVHIPEPADLEEKRAQREAGVEKRFKGANWREAEKPDSHVADSSPREPGPGDDGYHDGP
ncbi:hypothetical protein [Corynebacterium sp. CCUG 51687]|uniref:hypothetical protein n=1 Tax=Corynebacterium sp. CCUG 51687 TaxID=2823897 RepID=UPI002109969B|nr:hypothetical protein [Corynebacterium sp. CCUG 51687]MCQ4611860.1 helix-turn-helix transcriptional regulator [Corynebacterium sp. CCUG 51687]